jgi:hypothetical protein
MPGLDPGIHLLSKMMDCRVKPGNDKIAKANSMRVKSSIWVSAYIRRCFSAGAFAVVERKGAAEAGAIYLRVDLPDRTSKLFIPAPQSLYRSGADERLWQAYKDGAILNAVEAREAVMRETRIDPDVWIVAVEDVEGRSFLAEDLLVR